MLSRSQVKYIQSLAHKKSRDERNEFIAEGPKIVNELLEAKNVHIKHIYATKEWVHNNAKTLYHHPYTEISEEDLEQLSQLTTPNEVVCIIDKLSNKSPQLAGHLTLALETIQDPGNFGTIIRIADWFGIKQVICSNECADLYNPKVIQATMGSFARVDVIYLDLARWIGEQRIVKNYAATLGGTPVNEIGKLNEGLLIIGNESRGLSREIIEKVHERITIRGKGKAESLNAAVATGIILSHVV